MRALFNRQSARRWLNKLNRQRPKTYEDAMLALDEAKDIIRTQNTQIIRLIYDAHSDTLTGLLNPRGLSLILEHLSDRAGPQTPDSKPEQGVIIAVDMSRLKILNDEHGHAAGDKAIKTFAKAIKQNVRRTDFAARTGGDEFVIMLRNTTIQDSTPRIETLQTALKNVEFEHQDQILSVGARFGVAPYGPQTPIKFAIEIADQRQIQARKDEPDHMKRTPVLPATTLKS